MGTWHGGHRRQVRTLALPGSQGRLRQGGLRPALHRLPQSRVRRRADRLRGARPPRCAPIPRRPCGGAERPRHGAGRSAARQAGRSPGADRRPFAGRTRCPLGDRGGR
jgi:hypothetical protein